MRMTFGRMRMYTARPVGVDRMSAELPSRMKAHAARVERLIAMHEAMMKGM
jgi:hypothetical protein